MFTKVTVKAHIILSYFNLYIMMVRLSTVKENFTSYAFEEGRGGAQLVFHGSYYFKNVTLLRYYSISTEISRSMSIQNIIKRSILEMKVSLHCKFGK